MVIKGKKLIALAAMVAVVGTMLLTSTTSVLAASTYSRNAQALSFHPRANDLLSGLAGGVIGGALQGTSAIAGAIGGSAVAGAVGGAVGVLVGYGCPSAYSAATFAAGIVYAGLGDYTAYGGPIMVEALIPSTALDS